MARTRTVHWVYECDADCSDPTSPQMLLLRLGEALPNGFARTIANGRCADDYARRQGWSVGPKRVLCPHHSSSGPGR